MIATTRAIRFAVILMAALGSLVAGCSDECGGDGCDPPPSMPPPDDPPLLAGEGLDLQDVARDGSLIAYIDASEELFVISPDGGDPQSIATGVQRARFVGEHLLAFQGVTPDGLRAATMLDWPMTGTAESAGSDVVVSSPRASADGVHLFHLEKPVAGSLENIYLDGVELVADANSERARFGNGFMVLACNVDDGTGTTARWVKSYPLGGGDPVTLWPSGTSNRFVVTDDGERVVMAINENGDVADLFVIPVGGGMAESLVPQGSDNAFRILDDSRTLIFLSPDNPFTPSTFVLEAIGLDGSGRRILHAGNTHDIVSTSADALVYQTTFDTATSIGDLRLASADGTDDVGLTGAGLDEGFSGDDAHYIYLADAFRDGTGDAFGNLSVVAVATGTITVIASDVDRVSRAGGPMVLYLDRGRSLFAANVQTAESTPISGMVTDYEDLPDGLDMDSSRVVVSIESGEAAGLYLLDLSGGGPGIDGGAGMDGGPGVDAGPGDGG